MDEERRERVEQLLREGLDQKLLKSGTGAALGKLQEAHDEASRSPVLLEPWPSLTAYRLAHGLLRGASSAEELERVRELFERADAPGLLGPLPRIYQLAVLHRLRASRADAMLPAEIESAFRMAAQGVKERAGSPVPGRPSPRSALKGPIQDGALNLLELAAYFLGVPYEPLTGLGPFDDLQLGPSAWVLVGPDPRTRRIRYPEMLVRAELEERAAADREGVSFELRRSGEGCWRMGTGTWSRPRQSNSIMLLCGLLLRCPTLDALQRATVGGHDERGDTFRQYKSRLTRDLAELTGRPQKTLLEEDPASGVPRIAPGIQVFGAVEASHQVLRAAPR